jgi:hypothetical protein
MPDEASGTNMVRPQPGDELKSAYAEYASATLKPVICCKNTARRLLNLQARALQV